MSFGRLCLDLWIRVTDTWVVSADILKIWDSQDKDIEYLAQGFEVFENV